MSLTFLSYQSAIVNALSRQSQPVHAYRLAMQVYASPETVRYYLRLLETWGIVERPAGPRSGWRLRERSQLRLL